MTELSSPNHPPRRWRGRVVLVLQLAVSAALLAWVFTSVAFRADLLSVLREASPGWLIGGVVVAGLVQLMCFVRWRIFLTMAGVEVGWREAGGAFFGGLFAGLFLPGGAGGDVVKIGLLAARGHDVARSALSVVMDRLSGAVSLIVVGGGLIFWNRDWLMQSVHVAPLMKGVSVYLAVLALVLVLSVVLCAKGLVSQLPERWPGRGRLVELTGAYFQLAVQWPRTLGAVGLSCVMLVLYFLTFFFAARAYGAALTAGEMLAIMPAVDMISALPVSFGGLGVRESVFVLLLGELAAIGAAVAVTISLTGYLFSAAWALPGAVLWMWRGRQR